MAQLNEVSEVDCGADSAVVRLAHQAMFDPDSNTLQLRPEARDKLKKIADIQGPEQICEELPYKPATLHGVADRV